MLTVTVPVSVKVTAGLTVKVLPVSPAVVVPTLMTPPVLVKVPPSMS